MNCPGLLLAAAAIFSFNSVASAQAKTLLFEAPAGTGDVQLLKAAKALAARCVAQGLKGVTADLFAPNPPGPKRIRLTAAKEFTEPQIAVADFLASFPCKTIDIRFEHFLSKAEKETFKEGEEAPKGSTWTTFQEWERVEKPFVHFRQAKEPIITLLRDKPTVEAAGKFKVLRHPGGDLHGNDREAGIFLTFPGAMAKTLYAGIRKKPDPPHTDFLPLNLFIDGTRFPTNDGMMGWRNVANGPKDPPDLAIWAIPDLAAETPLAILLENPLPFAVKRSGN